MNVSIQIWKYKDGYENHQLSDPDFYIYSADILAHEPIEECLETFLEIVEDNFDNYNAIYNAIVDYELSPEEFNVVEFVKKNARVFKTTIEYADIMFNLHVKSKYNVNGLLGAIVSFEDKLQIDVSYSLMRNLVLPSWAYVPPQCYPSIASKRISETYAQYTRRHMNERSKNLLDIK